MGREGEQAEGAEAHVADGGVGDQPLPVGLHEADERPVQDGDERGGGQQARRLPRRVRKQRHGEAKQAVGAELQQQGGQQHGAGRGGLGMGVRQPGVDGEQGDFHGKTGEESPEEPPLGFQWQRGTGERGEREGPLAGEQEVLVVQRHETDQQHHRPEHRVNQKLHGGRRRAFAAVTGHQEVHGDQHDLEAEEEQQKVESEKATQHGGFEQQEPGVEGAVAGREQERQKTNAGGQQDEGEADAIDAEQVGGAPGGDPGGLFEELDPPRRVEAGDQGQGQSQLRRGDGESHQPGEGGGQRQNKEKTDDRPGQQGRQRMVHGVTIQCSL